MLDAELREILHDELTLRLGRRYQIVEARPVGGGCIHASQMISDGKLRLFLKTNTASAVEMFAAEADGLEALAHAGLRVPSVVAWGVAGKTAYLVLEYLDLSSLDARAGARLGEQLAQAHGRGADGETFGWRRANYIGATPQSNTPHRGWPAFFAQERLLPQLQRARARGMERTWVEKGERLAESLGAFFLDYHPSPSLVHGDLWGGNAAQLADGTPIVFDPAVYYADREVDLAMSELFGGFPESFYVAYRRAFPLDQGFERRKTLYNLYHVLNHFNLFGASYLNQARRMIDKLLAELRG
ncbi:MAG: fructosamine kinase family protein [Rhodocyclaceae bacterium]|nr:fructosamine kinase family protein [Rhodocyclaceae bacterium]